MNEMSTGCGGCKPQPMFVTYPYTRGAMYQCDCCSQMHQPSTARYPAGGPMQENAYMVANNVPYLIDNSTTKYGTKLSVADNVYTRFSKRHDPSCINMSAVIDMTGDQIVTNAVWQAFLEDFISNEYETLQSVLPIQKSEVFFRIHFHIEDQNGGGVVYENHVDSTVKEHLFHYTNITDYFITSFKNVAVTNIPQLDYSGIYSLFIDRVEARVNIIDTKRHYTDKSNPYYQWTQNNTHVTLQHETIQQTDADDTIVIAALEINHMDPVQLNVTTRLKICFTVFMANTIMVPNSFGVYKALFNASGHEIEDLKNRVTTLESTISVLNETIEIMQGQITDLDNRVTVLENPNAEEEAVEDPGEG